MTGLPEVLSVAATHAHGNWFSHYTHLGVGYFHPVLALVAGILILIRPKLLNIVVALYLIIVGLSGLVGHFI